MWLSIGQEHRLDLMELVTDVGIDKIMELLCIPEVTDSRISGLGTTFLKS